MTLAAVLALPDRIAALLLAALAVGWVSGWHAARTPSTGPSHPGERAVPPHPVAAAPRDHRVGAGTVVLRRRVYDWEAEQ